MLIPVGEDTALPITLVLLAPEPEIVHAVLRRLELDALHIDVEANLPAPPIGARLIVNAAERTKLTGRLLQADGRRWVVSRDRIHATDDRAAPRVRSRIYLRWRRQTAPATGWLSGAEDTSPMASFAGAGDLSLSGVRFELGDGAPDVPALGDRLLLELTIARQARRALGIVRRIDEQNSVAVEFLEVPEATFDALSEFTLNNL